MPPPELAADAPVADILHPVEVDLLKTLRHDLDLTVAHSLDGLLRQRPDPDEPLHADQRLDQLAAALADGHTVPVRLFFDHQPGRAHIGPQPLPAHETIETGIWPGVLVERRILVEDVDHRQVVALADLVVIRVVAGRDLERAGAKGAVHILVRDHRDGAVEDGDEHLLADQVAIALIFRVDGYRRIAQDGLRAGGRHRNEASRIVFQPVTEVVERAFLLFVFHFQIADGCLQAGTPVDQARPAIEQVFLPQANKCFPHSAGELVVHGETLAAPVATGAQATELLDDSPAETCLPFPGPTQEFLAADGLAAGAFFGEHTFHHELGGNAGVIRAGEPEGCFAPHTLIADHHVFQADEHGMALVQLAGHVRRRDADHERLSIRVASCFRFEPAVLLPPVIEPRLLIAEVKCPGHFVVHGDRYLSAFRMVSCKLKRMSLPGGETRRRIRQAARHTRGLGGLRLKLHHRPLLHLLNSCRNKKALHPQGRKAGPSVVPPCFRRSEQPGGALRCNGLARKCLLPEKGSASQLRSDVQRDHPDGLSAGGPPFCGDVDRLLLSFTVAGVWNCQSV